MNNKKIKILQVIGTMNRGGIQNWLLQVIKNIDRNKYTIDLLYHTDKKCDYDDELDALGINKYCIANRNNILKYMIDLRRIILGHGPYDIVHSQVDRFGGFTSIIGYYCGIRKIIVHSRSANTVKEKKQGRTIYNYFMKLIIKKYATDLLAVSKEAGLRLYGPNVINDLRFKIVTSAIDLSPFENLRPDKEIKKLFDVPKNVRVIGHVGNLVLAKNHEFLIDICAEICHRRQDIIVMLVGEGAQRPFIEEKIRQLGLINRIILTGTRSDVPQLLFNVFDVLLFPSKWEGSPRTVVEAQAAGLPCIISDSITEQVDLVKSLITRISLNQPISTWVDATLGNLNKKEKINQAEALEKIINSNYNIKNNVKLLESIYNSA